MKQFYERKNPHRLFRDRENAMLAGVCAGIAEYFGLNRKGVRLVIFDECHHLVGYWAQVALVLNAELNGPKVLGFTATPPAASDLSNTEVKLHKELLVLGRVVLARQLQFGAPNGDEPVAHLAHVPPIQDDEDKRGSGTQA